MFPSSAIAMAAAITVSGAAMPAAVTIVAKPKKKLIAGAMFASVAAAISKSDRTPRARRAGAGRSLAAADCFCTVAIDRYYRPERF